MRAVVGAIATAAAVGALTALGPAVLALPPPVGGDVADALLPVGSPGHLLGTDANGNDVLSRALHGGRVSLALALTVNGAAAVAGSFVGIACGYHRGRLDALAMRMLDIPIAFPSLIAVISVVHAFGPGFAQTAITLAVFAAPGFARVARSTAMPIAVQPYIQAARLCGASGLGIVLRHVAPAVAPAVVGYACLGIGMVVTLEGALGLLGLGVPPPAPSWGNMLADGRESIFEQRAPLIVPGMLLALTVWSFTAIADAARQRVSGGLQHD